MNRFKPVASGALVAILLGSVTAALAEPDRDRGSPRAERQMSPRDRHEPGEPHPGPAGYRRPDEPEGWNRRPPAADRASYQHNFQAARSYRVGPYHRPAGYVDRRWAFGQILPRTYWVAQYILVDYWLFGLEVPPAGFEWVRVGADALMVSVVNGEILQVEYGVFA